MGKKTNNFQAISRAAQKKHRRSRKPKFEVGKPKQGCDDKKKDKKKKIRKTKRVVKTHIADLREELAFEADELREMNQRLDEFPFMFAEIREINQQQQELNSEIDAHIIDQLNAWDDED